MKIRDLAVPMAVSATLGWPLRRSIKQGLTVGVTSWKTDPFRMLADVLVSTVYGQGIFWTIGQDYIGVYMNPKLKPGLGHRLARLIKRQLPDNDALAWALKLIEIGLDATKIPVEGRLYAELGVIPDGWAALVTQPGWSYIEVVEKTSGILLYPDRVTVPGNVEDSISSIYGTLVRHLGSAILWRYGPAIRTKLGDRIETGLHRLAEV